MQKFDEVASFAPFHPKEPNIVDSDTTFWLTEIQGEAKKLGKSVRYREAYQAALNGQLDAFKIAGKWRVRRPSFLAYIADKVE